MDRINRLQSGTDNGYVDSFPRHIHAQGHHIEPKPGYLTENAQHENGNAYVGRPLSDHESKYDMDGYLVVRQDNTYAEINDIENGNPSQSLDDDNVYATIVDDPPTRATVNSTTTPSWGCWRWRMVLICIGALILGAAVAFTVYMVTRKDDRSLHVTEDPFSSVTNGK